MTDEGPRDQHPAPAQRSWLDVRVRQARNPPPPVFRAVVANLVVAVIGAVVLIAWDWLAAHDPSLPDVGLALIAVYVVVVLVMGSLLTYLWVELPTGSADGTRRRSPWAALLGFFAAVPIVYLVLVVAMQIVRPLLG
jgi:nitrogen fixation/metabolism regulation signal transduction histidine kinase